MALYLDRLLMHRASIGRNCVSAGARTSFALDSAFVNGTSGDSAGFRYTCGSTDTIDEVYVFADAFQDLANVTMECRIYNAGITSSRAGSTLHATSTATTLPAGDDQWIKFAFGTPYNPALGEIVWIVVINTSADPVNDYPSLLTNNSNSYYESGDLLNGWGQVIPHTTTNGYSTNALQTSEVPIVIKQGSAYYGHPWTQTNITFYTNNTLERGIRFTCSEDVTVVGVQFTGTSAYDKFRITKSTTIPGAAVGSGEVEYDTDASGANDVNGFFVFDTPFTCVAGQAYNATLTYGANSQLPYVMQIEDYASYSSMFDTLRGYDTFSCPHGVISDGAGTPAWVEDKSICPSIRLIIGDHPLIDTPSVGNVHDDDTVRGAAGTLTLPAEAEVETGVQYGAGGTEFTGTLVAGGGGGGPVMGGMVVR